MIVKMGINLENIRKKIESDKYTDFMGIELMELGEGYSKLSMRVTEKMVNLHNVAHGGAIFSLADAAFAAASNSRGKMAVALSMNISYRSPAKEGMKLMAEAFEENLGRRTGLYRIIVKSEEGELIASSQGTVYIKSDK